MPECQKSFENLKAITSMEENSSANAKCVESKDNSYTSQDRNSTSIAKIVTNC